MEDKIFCHTCCLAVQQGMAIHGADKKEDAFLILGYMNRKDAADEKKGGFPTHECSEVKVASFS